MAPHNLGLVMPMPIPFEKLIIHRYTQVYSESAILLNILIIQ